MKSISGSKDHISFSTFSIFNDEALGCQKSSIIGLRALIVACLQVFLSC